MNAYLTIITTMMVVTQVIRVVQNTIQLKRQRKEIGETIGWFKDNDVSERDFVVQRECFYLLKVYLEKELGVGSGKEET